MSENNINNKILYIAYFIVWVVYPIASVYAYLGNKLSMYISIVITLVLVGFCMNLFLALFKGFLKICIYEADDIVSGF